MDDTSVDNITQLILRATLARYGESVTPSSFWCPVAATLFAFSAHPSPTSMTSASLSTSTASFPPWSNRLLWPRPSATHGRDGAPAAPPPAALPPPSNLFYDRLREISHPLTSIVGTTDITVTNPPPGATACHRPQGTRLRHHLHLYLNPSLRS
jgi:hypothetical protein